MTPPETKAPEDYGAVDASNYAKAILNILEDFAQERARQGDSDRAILNILDDFDVEKRRVDETNVSLQDRTAELGRSNSELELFAYVASHDLQEPLRMITSYTQLLAKRYRGRLDSDADDFIDFIVDGATRMSALISDVLNYSRVGSRDLELTSADCDEILEQVLTNLRQRVESTGAVVTYDPLPTVVADPSQLAQLFQNLVDNAIKFCTEKSPAVHIGAHKEADGWKLFVRDNGIGIDPSYNERIFQAFQRLHSREYSGTGIGLAICKKIVERHGGRLWIESESGGGSTFSFTLPSREATTL